MVKQLKCVCIVTVCCGVQLESRRALSWRAFWLYRMDRATKRRS